MKTYGQVKEAIRDICTPCGVNEIKSANKQIKKFIGNQLVDCFKTEDQLSTIMYYDFIDEEGNFPRIGWDFWNHRLVTD